MSLSLPRPLAALLAGLVIASGPQAFAQSPQPAAAVTPAPAGHDHAHDTAAGHAHSHAHAHAHDVPKPKTVENGWFEDSQIKDRPLSNYAGDWQSADELLASGALDEVMAHKAESGDKTADEHRAYYEAAYKTDVDKMTIDGDTVTYRRPTGSISGKYAADGYEVLSYEDGHRGVRFFFRKVEGDADAPGFIAFSDHLIAPQKAAHFHLYAGNDRAALAKRGPHWPTYYPAALSGDEVAAEMMAH